MKQVINPRLWMKRVNSKLQCNLILKMWPTEMAVLVLGRGKEVMEWSRMIMEVCSIYMEKHLLKSASKVRPVIISYKVEVWY